MTENETVIEPPAVDYPHYCGYFAGLLESLSWENVDDVLKRYVKARDEKDAAQAARTAWHNLPLDVRINSRKEATQ
jgi:hypothetical protein